MSEAQDEGMPPPVNCDGKRPVCDACLCRNDAGCVFETEPGQTRLDALRIQNSNQSNAISELNEVLHRLQHSPYEEALDVLSGIRSGKTAIAGNQPHPSAASSATLDVSLHGGQPLHTTSRSASESTPTRFRPVLAYTPSPQVQNKEIAEALAYVRSNSRILRHAVSVLLNCANPICQVMCEGEGDALLTLASRPDITGLPLETVCAICSLVAVASRYSQRAVPSEIGQQFFSVAKSMFENPPVTESRDAPTICFLLALYCLIVKADMSASIYIRVGLDRVRRTASHSTGPVPDPAASRNARKIYLMLRFCEVWFEMITGITPELDFPDDAKLQWQSFDLEGFQLEDESVDDESDVFRMEITRACAEQVSALRMFRRKGLSSSSIRQFVAASEHWHSSLPEQQQLGYLLEPQTAPLDRMRAYYMQLFHWSAKIRLYGFVLSHCFEQQEQDNTPFFTDTPEAVACVSEGALTAETAARILHLMYSEQTPGWSCFICLFQVIATARILLYITVQKQLHGVTCGEWSVPLDLASKLVDMLAEWAKLNPIAQEAYDDLKLYVPLLNAVQPAPADDRSASSPSPAKQKEPATVANVMYLFTLVRGDDLLHHAARKLAKMACNPYERRLSSDDAVMPS